MSVNLKFGHSQSRYTDYVTKDHILHVLIVGLGKHLQYFASFI